MVLQPLHFSLEDWLKAFNPWPPADLEERHVVVVVHPLGGDPAQPARVGRRDGRDDGEEVGLGQRARLARYPAERHLSSVSAFRFCVDC